MYVRVVVYAVIRLHRSVYVRPCVRVCVREMPFCLLLGLFLSACTVCAVFIYFRVRSRSCFVLVCLIYHCATL